MLVTFGKQRHQEHKLRFELDRGIRDEVDGYVTDIGLRYNEMNGGPEQRPARASL